MAPRPQILFLSHCFPFPPESGPTARTFNILRQLHKEFDITLVAFSRLNHQPDSYAREASRQALATFLRAAYPPVMIPGEHSILRHFWDHLRSLASGKPYTYYEYSSKLFRLHLRDALRQISPDLIHLDSLDLYRWRSELPHVAMFCTHHDIESQLLRRRAERVKNPVLRKYILYQSALIEQVQRELCPRFSGNLTMSRLDSQQLQSIAPGSRTMVVPNGVDTTYFIPMGDSSSVRGRVTFVGSPSFPNRDAMNYLLMDIWPLIRTVDRSANLQVIGRFPESEYVHYRTEHAITYLGHVTDIRPYMAETCCCVVPIRIGGGTRLKILDAWAMGKPVVSTQIGCEGLNAVDGHNILIRDTPEAFAQGVLKVISDPELRMHLGMNGRKTAEETYSWDVIGNSLREYYRTHLRQCHGVADHHA